ncbi:MAG: NYN domain-containing protein [Candidatus Paceibacterota bacterium]
MSKSLKTGGRVYVFIDAANIWDVQKSKGKWFDYEKLKQFLKDTFDPSELKIFYYSAYPADGTRDYDLDGKHRFFTFLKKGVNFTVRKKPLKRIRADSEEGEYIIEKGDMDVELTIDVVGHMENYDTAVFFTGDSDFLALISYIRQKNKKVYVFSSENNISNELRTGSDGYRDILKIADDVWGKDLRYRRSKKKDS